MYVQFGFLFPCPCLVEMFFCSHAMDDWDKLSVIEKNSCRQCIQLFGMMRGLEQPSSDGTGGILLSSFYDIYLQCWMLSNVRNKNENLCFSDWLIPFKSQILFLCLRFLLHVHVVWAMNDEWRFDYYLPCTGFCVDVVVRTFWLCCVVCLKNEFM